ncbi:MAG: hypothetical protein DRJ52_03420 [Thermoprotei archaeon]|nr:MAG: hypothetical protein DRJ52_03420 [Thermoprotei archaeon]RLE99084.1 MAG: hypothetical protein DRJ63_06350 [Thermoprotei archaeon]
MPSLSVNNKVFRITEVRGGLSLLQKLIPFGIYPGAKIKVLSIGRKGVLIEVNNSIVFLDNKIFSKIYYRG